MPFHVLLCCVLLCRAVPCGAVSCHVALTVLSVLRRVMSCCVVSCRADRSVSVLRQTLKQNTEAEDEDGRARRGDGPQSARNSSVRGERTRAAAGLRGRRGTRSDGAVRRLAALSLSHDSPLRRLMSFCWMFPHDVHSVRADLSCLSAGQRKEASSGQSLCYCFAVPCDPPCPVSRAQIAERSVCSASIQSLVIVLMVPFCSLSLWL